MVDRMQDPKKPSRIDTHGAEPEPKRPAEDLDHLGGEPPTDLVTSRHPRGSPLMQYPGLLALQRAAGNRAVAGEMGRRPALPLPADQGSLTVQRAGEFIPTIAPPPNLPLRLFQRHTHVWKMTNWRAAPRGTDFHWGWGINPESARIVKDSTADNGATTRIELEVRRPPKVWVSGTPVHQVPGGPEVQGKHVEANYTVAQPTLSILSFMARKPDGSPSDKDHLSVGDKLTVRVRVGNVDGRHMEDPSVWMRSGKGTELLEANPALKRVQTLPDGRTYDLEFTARTAGSFDQTVELNLGDIPLGKGPAATGVNGEVEFDRQHFLNLANQCDTTIARAYTRANSVMEVVSAAYGNAYDSHEKTLRAQSASNRLAEEIILSAALAFIPGGVGGVVGGMMKKATKNEFLIDGIKDMAKAGARGVQAAVVGKQDSGNLTPMAKDPRTWRAQYAVRVNTEKEKVLDLLNSWKTKANNSDPTFYRNFDPVAVMDKSLVSGGEALKDVPVPDQVTSQKQYELGMWKEWLQTYGYTVVESPGMYGGRSKSIQENQGKKIRDRINALGEDGDAWLERYGGVALERARKESAGWA